MDIISTCSLSRDATLTARFHQAAAAHDRALADYDSRIDAATISAGFPLSGAARNDAAMNDAANLRISAATATMSDAATNDAANHWDGAKTIDAGNRQSGAATTTTATGVVDLRTRRR